MKKALFFVSYLDDPFGIGIVATSRNKAKSYVFYNSFDYDEYINIRVKKIKIPDEEIKKLPFGEIDLITGLKLNIYHYIEDQECSDCKEKNLIMYVQNIFENKLICDECLRKKGIFEVGRGN